MCAGRTAATVAGVQLHGAKLLLAALAVLAVAGCIGASAAGAAPTREEYIAQVDPICKQASRDLHRILTDFQQALEKGKPKRAARFLRRAARRFDKSIDAVEAVEPPAEDVALIAQFVALLRKDAEIARKRAGALEDRRAGAYKRLTRKGFANFREIQELMEGYGFHYCV